MNEGSHPDLELLSDLHAGTLPGERADELERHLEHCPSCLALLDSLVDVQGLLRTVGDRRPVMPTELDTRLTEAIRAEASSFRPAATDTADPGEAGPAASGESGASDRDVPHVARTSSAGRSGRSDRSRRTGHAARPRSRSRLTRGLAVAASLAVLAIGGTVGYQSLLAESSDQPPTATEQQDDRPGQGEDDRTYALAEGPVRLTEQGFDSQVADAVVAGSKDRTPDSRPDGTGDTDPPSAIDHEKPGQDSGPDEGPNSGPDTNDGNPGLARPDSCVRDALDARANGPGDDAVLDVGSARFDGARALLVITRGADSGTVHAWAVVGCPDDGSVAYDAEVPVDR